MPAWRALGGGVVVVGGVIGGGGGGGVWGGGGGAWLTVGGGGGVVGHLQDISPPSFKTGRRCWSPTIAGMRSADMQECWPTCRVGCPRCKNLAADVCGSEMQKTWPDVWDWLPELPKLSKWWY